MALTTILSGLEGGTPSTCSFMVITRFSLPSLCLDWFLDTDDLFSYCEVSRAVQHLKKHCREDGSELFGTRYPDLFKWLQSRHLDAGMDLASLKEQRILPAQEFFQS